MMLARWDGSVQIFGVRLVGLNETTIRKLALAVLVIALAVVLGKALQWLGRKLLGGDQRVHARFWWDQSVRIVIWALAVLLLVSIWFDDPQRLTTVAGLVSAGVAIALQRVITAFAAYFIILRGRIFRAGDRIVMGGVRGDVLMLGFLRTTIMEMGQPPPVQKDEPAIWVEARQYSGRIVTVTNDKIFDEPVYNYSRDFPFIWEELHLPIPYTADRGRAEQILLEAARRHTTPISQVSAEALQELRRRYFVDSAELEPRVYWNLTDNWLALSVRFVTRERGVRELKDAMSREILANLDAAGISVASGTYEIVGVPPIKIIDQRLPRRPPSEMGESPV
jgi:small-conductance mechanosensitive channel